MLARLVAEPLPIAREPIIQNEKMHRRSFFHSIKIWLDTKTVRCFWNEMKWNVALFHMNSLKYLRKVTWFSLPPRVKWTMLMPEVPSIKMLLNPKLCRIFVMDISFYQIIWPKYEIYMYWCRVYAVHCAVYYRVIFNDNIENP